MNARFQTVAAATPLPSASLDPASLRRSALTVVETEARAIQELKSRIDESFLRACELIGD